MEAPILIDIDPTTEIEFNHFVRTPITGFLSGYTGELLTSEGKDVSATITRPNGKRERVSGWEVIVDQARQKALKRKTPIDSIAEDLERINDGILAHVLKNIKLPMLQKLNQLEWDDAFFTRVGFGNDFFEDGYVFLYTPLPSPCKLPDYKFDLNGKSYKIKWYNEKDLRVLLTKQ